jgi:peptidoglycan/xylan/chitin deacetylase (PgdA/CDA1 family)
VDLRNTVAEMFVLNFHGLGEPGRHLSVGEDNCWISRLLFSEILDVVRARRDAQVTFDDSNESDYSIALPLLKAKGVPARFFLVAERIGQKGFLSQQQIQSLVTEGMAVGNHGMRHRRWTGLSEDNLFEELVTARERIQQVTRTHIAEAACPFGCYNRKVLHRLFEFGYERVYTSDGGAAVADSWILPRNSVLRSHSAEQILEMICESLRGRKRLWRKIKMTIKRWRW